MAAHYSEAVRMRCRDPRRAGGWPEGTARVGTGTRGSLDDGLWACLQVRVSPDGRVIDDARFRVFGCSAAVASASFVADALVGVAPGAVSGLDPRQVAAALALPEDKRDMAAMAVAAARAAVDDWAASTGVSGLGLEATAQKGAAVGGRGAGR